MRVASSSFQLGAHSEQRVKRNMDPLNGACINSVNA